MNSRSTDCESSSSPFAVRAKIGIAPHLNRSRAGTGILVAVTTGPFGKPVAARRPICVASPSKRKNSLEVIVQSVVGIREVDSHVVHELVCAAVTMVATGGGVLIGEHEVCEARDALRRRGS